MRKSLPRYILRRGVITDTQGNEINTKTEQFKSRWDDERGYRMYHNRKAVWGMKLPYPDEIDDADLGRLTRLSHYLVGDSNMLGYRGNGNRIRSMTASDMGDVLNRNERTVFRLLQTATHHKLMHKVAEIRETSDGVRIREVKYYMNPLYFSVNKTISVGLFLMFQDELIPHMPPWVVNNYLNAAKELPGAKQAQEEKKA